jgi:SAM-dependent methyltransferase
VFNRNDSIFDDRLVLASREEGRLPRCHLGERGAVGIGSPLVTKRTPALAAMHSWVLPRVYERWVRPMVRVLHGWHGLDEAAERRIAHQLLKLHSGQSVLDVGCGPGNFTRCFAPAVGAEGLVVGFDESATFLATAVGQPTPGPVVYVRGDAQALPFSDETFDAVGCFLALHLIPEPFRALREMLRVLAPGGRIAIMASYKPSGPVAAMVDRAFTTTVGIHSFGRDELTGAFCRSGLVDVQQRVTGLLQFVGARKPG